MACYDAGTFTCTYDSDALEGKDYSVLATWEAASDNDLSGTGITVLDCYDSQVHDDEVNIAGATNTDITHYRVIRSSSSCTTPFAGKAGTGATLSYTNTGYQPFVLSEEFARLVNLCITASGTRDGAYGIIQFLADNTFGINIVAYDCVNQYAGQNVRAVLIRENQCLAYNFIVYGGDDHGIELNVAADETGGAICCTSVGNAGCGIYSREGLGVAIVFSCYAMDNTTSAFNEADWDAPSGWNGADDATADLGGTAGDNYKNSVDYDASLDADFLATANISANAAAGDRCGRNPYNDVTATTDFNDFLRNDTAGDALFGFDIAGNARPNEAVADSAWDVGASEYVAAGGGLSIPVAQHHLRRH